MKTGIAKPECWNQYHHPYTLSSKAGFEQLDPCDVEDPLGSRGVRKILLLEKVPNLEVIKLHIYPKPTFRWLLFVITYGL